MSGSGALLAKIDALKASVDLAALIGGSVKLWRSGRASVGCCPFHSERTESFYVYPDGRGYYCFGCGAWGDVFDWLLHANGMALVDAVRHLGGDAIAGTSADFEAARAERKARDAAQSAADRSRKMGEAARYWRNTVPIAGTIGEQYLIETRGIPCPAGGWPDCVRFLRGNGKLRLTAEGPDGEEIAYTVATAGALIVGATTTDGTLCAVQRIYLDADAQNIRRQDAKGSKVKLTAGTFAAIEGISDAGAVRLPGPADGPVLIAEGAETALSVWSATGHETWVTLGNVANATPPRGRRVVICRDDDKPHSAADRQLGRALGRWREAGHGLAVATPWPERRGDKSDFNDTLRAAGLAAVRARIVAALDPTKPMPSGPDTQRKQTVRAAFYLLRMGVPTDELLAVLHQQNQQRTAPLSVDVIGNALLWAVKRHMEQVNGR